MATTTKTKEKEPELMWRIYNTTIELTERMLAVQPSNPKAREQMNTREDEHIVLNPLVDKDPDKDTDKDPDDETKKLSPMVFHRFEARTEGEMPDNGVICLMNYQVKGFFKEAASNLPHLLGVPGRKKSENEDPSDPSSRLVKSRIDRWLFINPRYIRMCRFGQDKSEGLKAPDGTVKVNLLPGSSAKGYLLPGCGAPATRESDGTLEPRSVRCDTRQGPRIALTISEYVERGTIMNFDIRILNRCPITADSVYGWLLYGEEGIGLLGFRTGGYGQFKILNFEDVTDLREGPRV